MNSGEDHMSGAGASLLGALVAERYLVERYLGEGGMGMVYLARHVTLEKQVALKVLHGEFARKPDLVERFLQEAKSASRIRNPHIIDITDFGVTDQGFVFFAMEFLEGRDLHALLHATAADDELLPWRRTKRIFLQVCSALSAAHEKGVIHRDLKPENIFLVDNAEQRDYVKLLDFGIAKMQSLDGNESEGERKLTKTGMIFGTPEYMAPEQAKGEQPDHRVDVYAMGCLLFQMVTGSVPFSGDTFMAVLAKHMASPIPVIDEALLARSGAPPAIADVITKALAKDRDSRYSNMEELATAVKLAGGRRSRASSHAPIENWTGSVRLINDIAEDEERLDEVSRGRGGSKWLIGGVIVAAVVAGAAVSAVLGLGSNPSSEPSNDAPQQGRADDALHPAVEASADAAVLVEEHADTNRADAGKKRTNRRPRPDPRDETIDSVTDPAPLPAPEEFPEETSPKDEPDDDETEDVELKGWNG